MDLLVAANYARFSHQLVGQLDLANLVMPVHYYHSLLVFDLDFGIGKLWGSHHLSRMKMAAI